FPAGDANRQISAALLAALTINPGSTPVSVDILPETPKLQELLDPDVALEIVVEDGFTFWVENPAEMTPEIEQSLQQANEAAPPTARLKSVDAAYWSHERDRAWVRWVMPQDEHVLLNSFARLHAARVDSLGEDNRYVGAFRCQGLLAPVWEVPTTRTADDFEDGAKTLAERLGEA